MAWFTYLRGSEERQLWRALTGGRPRIYAATGHPSLPREVLTCFGEKLQKTRPS
jgi:hypothetical protein